MSKPALSPQFLANRFRPGESGNPAGRPKRASFEAIVASILDEKVPGAEATKREALARVFVDMMLKRNGQMVRDYLDREWPKTTKVDIELPGVDAAGLVDAVDAFASRRIAAGTDREPGSDADGGSV